MDMQRKAKKRQPKITNKPHSSEPGKIDRIKIGKRFLRRVPTILTETKDFNERDVKEDAT